MKDALVALMVVIAVVLGVSTGAQAGPSRDEVAFVDVEVIPLLLGIVTKAPEKAIEQVVWDWEAQLCYVRAGYAPQPPPQGRAARALPADRFAALETLRRPVERLADGRRHFRGDWPRGRILRS